MLQKKILLNKYWQDINIELYKYEWGQDITKKMNEINGKWCTWCVIITNSILCFSFHLVFIQKDKKGVVLTAHREFVWISSLCEEEWNGICAQKGVSPLKGQIPINRTSHNLPSRANKNRTRVMTKRAKECRNFQHWHVMIENVDTSASSSTNPPSNGTSGTRSASGGTSSKSWIDHGWTSKDTYIMYELSTKWPVQY